MMWLGMVSLITSSIEASVVVLPDPVGTGDEDEPARQIQQLTHRRRKADFFERQERTRNEPQSDAEAAFLPVNADTKAVVAAKGESRNRHCRPRSHAACSPRW
jgi:hypothetical protein